MVGAGFLGGVGSLNRRKGGCGGSEGGPKGGCEEEPGDEGGGGPTAIPPAGGGGVLPPPAAAGPVWVVCAGGGHRSWSSRLLISGVVGTARGRFRRVVPGIRRSGLPSSSGVGGFDGALVRVWAGGLLHAGGGLGRPIGVVGSGIRVATC